MLRTALLAAPLLLLAVLPAAEAQGVSPPAGHCQAQGPVRFFWHYACLKLELDRIQSTYPKIAKYYEIGKSVRNNPIYVLEIANLERQAKEPGRPGFYLDATHHGNEIQGTEAAMILARRLVADYGKDADVTRWVDEFNIYINPVVNPDGNLANQRLNANGVDLNRNYPFQHGARATNAGPRGASEPETQAQVKFMTEKDLDIYLSLHTGTWDYVVPRCDPGNFRGRVPTDDEPLYEWALAELLQVTSGMSNRGASGTGESICWAYDVIDVWTLLPEVASQQGQLFTVAETTQLNNAMKGIYWMLNYTGRWGAVLDAELLRNSSAASGISIQVTNSGLAPTTNWTLQLTAKGSTRAPLLRGSQNIPAGGNLRIDVPSQYLSGDIEVVLRYDHLNVNPLASDPNGISKDPRWVYLNFTEAQVLDIRRAAGLKADGGAPGPAVILALLGLVALALVRRRA